MSKHKVIIELSIDPSDYHNEVEDTDAGAVNLVINMLYGDADFPETMKVCCGDVCETIEEVDEPLEHRLRELVKRNPN